MIESNLPVPFVPAPAGPSFAAPKTIGQILDRTFRLARAHFWLLVGIAAVPSALILLVIAAMEAVLFAPVIAQWPHPAPDAMLRSFTPAVLIPTIVIVTILNTATFAIYMAASCHASTQADSGIEVTFRQAYQLAWNRSGRHIWLLVWIYLRSFLPLLAIYISMAGGVGLLVHTKTTPNLIMTFLFLLGFLLLIPALVYGILVILRLSLAFPACVEEGLTARASIERSSRLTQGAKGRIFLVMLVIHAVLYAMIMALEFVAMLLSAMGVLAAAALHIHPAAPWSYIGIGLCAVCLLAVMILSMALTYAALTTALAVLYHDQRLCKDALFPAPPPAGEYA
jgi:hypothetical protein